MAITYSEAEGDYIKAGVIQNIRNDGRERLDFRQVTVETNVFSQTNGSARVLIGDGSIVDVIAVTKVEVGEPEVGNPKEGRLHVSVECSPVIFSKFGNNSSEKKSAELSQMLSRIICNSKALNFESLCILPGKFCWVIYLDIMILMCDGSITDVASFAAFSALNCTRIPHIEIIHGEDGGDEDDFEISEDIANAKQIDASKVPILITLSKIENYIVVDTTGNEESCVSASLTVAVNKDGKICGLQKGSGGSFFPTELESIVQGACGIAKGLFPRFFDVLAHFSKIDSENPYIPCERPGFLS